MVRDGLLLAFVANLCLAVGQLNIGSSDRSAEITPDDVHVNCLQDMMEVSIAKNKLQRIQSPKKLHLMDPACLADATSFDFVGRVPLSRCGTTKRFQQNAIVYTNRLMTKYPVPAELNKKCPVLSVKFSCEYPYRGRREAKSVRVVEKVVQCEHIIGIGPAIQSGILALSRARARVRMRQRTVKCPMIIGIAQLADSSVAIKDRVTSSGFIARRKTVVCNPLEGAGTYKVEMIVFSDKMFTKPITGVHVADKEFVDVYYSLRLLADDSNVEIMPSTCYATPDADPNNKVNYYFLKNGCILDNTVQFYASGPRQSRFSIRSFKFHGQDKSAFYVHCKVSICELNDLYSTCRQGCINEAGRLRRQTRRWSLRVEKKITRVPELSSVCLNGKMEIALKKELYDGVFAKQFHMNDKDCIARDNGTHFVLKNPVGRCGAMRSDGKSNVVFKNMVYLDGDNKHTDFFPMEVSCSFAKHQSESTRTGYRLTSSRRFFLIKNAPQYRMHFKMLIARDVPQKYARTPVDIATKINGGILDIVTKAKYGNLMVRMKHCTMKKSLFSEEKIQLIHKGCPASKKILFYERMGDSEMLRILLESKSIPAGKIGHLTCTLLVCTPKDPECFESCGVGLPVKGKAIFSRQRRSTDPLDMDISCGRRSMTVAIRKNTLPPLKAANLRLRDSACRALENKTHFIFTTPLGGCGTAMVHDNDKLAYTNEVKQDVPGLVIIRQQLLNIPFRCLYRTKMSASSGIFRLKSPSIQFTGSAQGVYQVKVKMFTDSTFTKERDGILALVDPEKDMYFEVGMKDTKAKLAIMLDQCYGRPTVSQNEREKYVFIRDGCGVDDTVKIYKSPSYDTARFSIKPFLFSDKPVNSIYVTCLVTACNPNDPNSRCFQGCPL